MTEAGLIMTIFAAVLLPVVIFSVSALMATHPKDLQQSDIQSEEFLLASRSISPGDFVNSSTGYMLQVSTTFYFIFWGYNYGFSNVFYMITWAAGIFLFSLFAARLIEYRVDHTTLPRLLSFNRSRLLRIVAAAATILSFVGVIYVESYFTADLVLTGTGGQSSAGSATFSPTWWVVLSIVLVLTVAYSAMGGLRKVVANDVWQLSFSYLGLSGVFAYLLDLTYRSSASDGLLMSGLLLAILLILIGFDRRILDGKIKLFALIISAGLIAGVTVSHIAAGLGPLAASTLPGPLHQVSESWGWFTLLGFTVTNLFWQFADSSVLQRISALRLADDQATARIELRRALRALAVVSPLTWSLGIILGMLIRTAAIGVSGPGAEYFALVENLRQGALAGEIIPLLVLSALVMGLVSIMMSTVDVAIIAATQSFFTDFFNDRRFRPWHGSLFGLVLLIITFAFAYVHSTFPQSSVLTVMAGAYGAVLSLAPSAMARLLQKEINPAVDVIAILAGVTGSLFATFGPIQSLPSNVTLVLPIFAAFVPALLIVLAGLFLAKRRAIQEGD